MYNVHQNIYEPRSLTNIFRQLVVTAAQLQSRAVSTAVAGGSAPQFDRVEYVRLGSGGVQVLVGLPVERTTRTGV